MGGDPAGTHTRQTVARRASLAKSPRRGRLALSLALAARCGDQTTPPPSNVQLDPPEPTHEQPADPAGPQQAQLGQPAERSSWRITVTQLGWSTKNLPCMTEQGLHWLVFQVTWEPRPTEKDGM